MARGSKKEIHIEAETEGIEDLREVTKNVASAAKKPSAGHGYCKQIR